MAARAGAQDRWREEGAGAAYWEGEIYNLNSQGCGKLICQEPSFGLPHLSCNLLERKSERKRRGDGVKEERKERGGDLQRKLIIVYFDFIREK